MVSTRRSKALMVFIAGAPFSFWLFAPLYAKIKQYGFHLYRRFWRRSAKGLLAIDRKIYP